VQCDPRVVGLENEIGLLLKPRAVSLRCRRERVASSPVMARAAPDWCFYFART